METKHLDFGCGDNPRNPFGMTQLHVVDLEKKEFMNAISIQINQGDKCPYPNNYFDSVSAYDVLEHLPRESQYGNLFIFYMNEFYRILKPKGKALFVFPALPNLEVFSDPTHVNYLIRSSLNYFLGSCNEDEIKYGGIKTQYRILKVSRLRFAKKYVLDPSYKKEEVKKVRRKISLTKRSILNFFNPTHEIWILEKIK